MSTPSKLESQTVTKHPPSAKLIAAARENGKKGGRPKKRSDYKDFTDIPAPPRHPLRLAYWIQRIIALDARRIEQGRGNKELSKALRAYARAMSQIMSAAIMMAALEPEGEWRQGDGELDGPLTEHPFGVAYWLLLRMARGVERVIRGEPDPHGVELRAMVSTYVKVIPPDAMFEAHRTLKREHAALDADSGPTLHTAKEPHNGSKQHYRPVSCEMPRR